jgi:hypothetical protein
VTYLISPENMRRIEVMSLTVSLELQAKAEAGEVSDAEMVECVRTSLPYAWSIVSRVVGDLGDELTAELIWRAFLSSRQGCSALDVVHRGWSQRAMGPTGPGGLEACRRDARSD